MRFGRKQAPPTRRQRLPVDAGPKPSTYSYHARRSDFDVNLGRDGQREALAKRSRQFGDFWLQRFGVLILSVVVIISLINSLLLSNNVTIRPLSASGTSFLLRDPKVYEQAANKLMAGSLANHTKLTINTGKLEQSLLSQFPELASAKITLPLLSHHAVVHVQPARPAMILQTRDGSFVIDSTGRVMMPSTSIPTNANLQLPVVSDQSSLAARVGHQILTPLNVAFLQTVVAQLNAKNVHISSMVLPAAASELDVHIAGQPYFVKFNLQHDTARQQAGTFLATQAQLKRQNIVPSKYIDVRIDGRAYYQ